LIALQSWGTPGTGASSSADVNTDDPYATQSLIPKDVEEDDDIFADDAAMAEAECDSQAIIDAQEKNEQPAPELLARVASRQTDFIKVARKNQLRKKTVGVRRPANSKASS
jgi:hypothetical protein